MGRGPPTSLEAIWTKVLRQGIASGEFRESIDPKPVYRLNSRHGVDRSALVPARRLPEAGQDDEQYLAVMVDGVARH